MSQLNERFNEEFGDVAEVSKVGGFGGETPGTSSRGTW